LKNPRSGRVSLLPVIRDYLSLNIFLLFSLFYLCRLLFLLLPLLLSIPPENKRILPLYTTLSEVRLGVLENYLKIKEYL